MSSHEAEPVVGNLHEYDTTRPHSFDLTLELERQLEAESLPASPARPVGRPQSLDTHVLASLVTSLRVNVAELTKERDELSATFEVARAREADLASEVRQLRDSQAEKDLELAALRQKIRDDEESIVLLRSKVEESRRGLMRLQTESRRVSRGGDLSVDLSRASSFSFGGPSSAKRMSFTPLTGTSAARMQNHRRISSVSDTNVNWSDVAGGQTANTSPNSLIITLPETSPQPGYLPTNNRRISGLFGRPVASESEPISGLNPVEREKLQGEIQALKTALEETRHDLMEATEAREASETCVKTLRDFIAENNVGVPSVRVDIGSAGNSATRGDDADKKSASGNGGSRWGFGGLFRAGDASSPVLPSRGTSATASPPAASEPLSRKLGGLFSGRGSFSSSTSAPARGVPVVQEAMYNSSDTSSTAESAEPASPSIDTSHVQIARVLSGASSTSSELVSLRNVSEETEIPGKHAADVLVVRRG
ncbi:hypothetical protein EDB87DRAFT_439999 [Lactarius vividus]|nr:hypothetical protein EDB87DRAFT_439999 [Lactarius vividus]